MDLLKTGSVPKTDVVQTFGTSALASLVMFLVFSLSSVALPVLLMRNGLELPWFAWIVLGPLGLLVALILLVICSSLFGLFWSSLKSSNWKAKMGYDGVYLNLRSYGNAHFEGEHPTVVHVPFRELRSAGKLTEKRVWKSANETVHQSFHWVELTLSNVDLAPLEELLQLERALEAPKRKGLFGTTQTKLNHDPLRVRRPDVIQVEAARGLLQALSPRVDIAPSRKVNLSPQHRASKLAHDRHLLDPG